MRGERFVVLGLAHARSGWFQDLARWATAASLPVEFVKCLSIEELRARLASGRAFSALIVDAGVPGVDRDLLGAAHDLGIAVLVVDDGRAHRDWSTLGVGAVLPANLDRAALLEALQAHAHPIGRGDVVAVGAVVPADQLGRWRGELFAVTGSGGTGASTVAMALGQGLGTDVRFGGLVLVADFALTADLAVLHDAGDVVPGLQELVDAYRGGHPTLDAVRSLVFTVPERQYDLLLGLRRHRDWVTVRPRAFEVALDGLRRAYKAVVADVSPDLEGEAECGSFDVEERNLLARSTTSRAEVVVVVGLPGLKGTHRLIAHIDALVSHQVDPARILPVVNRAPRNPRARAELVSAIAELTRATSGSTPLAPPLFLPERRRLEDTTREGARMPAQLVAPLAAAVTAVVDRLPDRRAAASGVAVAPPGEEPVPVTPGSLGVWHPDGGEEF